MVSDIRSGKGGVGIPLGFQDMHNYDILYRCTNNIILGDWFKLNVVETEIVPVWSTKFS